MQSDSTNMEATRPPKSQLRAQSLRAARLAAVQSVYSHKISNHSLDDLLRHGKIKPFKAELQYDDGMDDDYYKDEMPDSIPADYPHFKKLLQKTLLDWQGLSNRLNDALEKSGFDGYVPQRETLLLSIIMVGVCELTIGKKEHGVRLVNEYVTIAGGFYSDKEAGLVNHILEILRTYSPK